MSMPARVFTRQLPEPERVLLWAMRAWVIGLKRRFDVSEAIRSAFHTSRLPDATELIDALMSILACGATRTLVIECVCYPAVGDDEQRLLAAAALHQAGSGLRAVSDLKESDLGFPLGSNCDSSCVLGMGASMHGTTIFAGPAGEGCSNG